MKPFDSFVFQNRLTFTGKSFSAVAFKSNIAPLEHRDIQEPIVFVVMCDASFVVRVFREVNQLNMAKLLLGFRRL